MSCARCGRSSANATTLSTHHTSQGWVRYRRCPCGATSIRLLTLADPGTRDTGRQEAARSAPARSGPGLDSRELHVCLA